MAKTENLSDKIATVLRNGAAASDVLRSLLASSETELARLQKLHAEKREAALDPLLSTADIREIRQVAEDAAFEVDRLNAARERLDAMLAEAVETERALQRAQRYQETLKRRDALGKRIAQEYPAIQKSLVSLITDIVALSVEINAVNANLPDGAEVIEKPEGFARGFSQITRDPTLSYSPPLITEMMVPIFDDPRKVAWPPDWNGHDTEKRIRLHEVERFAGEVVPLHAAPIEGPDDSETKAA